MSEDNESKIDKVLDPDLNNDNAIQAIAVMLSEMRTQMSKLTPVIEQADAKKAEITKQEDEIKKELQELAAKKHAISDSVWEARKAMRDLERRINSESQRLTQAVENKKQREELSRLSEELDRITEGMPWRDAAFPHQISGAKALAVQHRGILADTMGLGKSLTAIIYMDMIKAKRILMVVPNDTTQNMVREIKHWAPHRNVVDASGMPKATRDFILTTLPQMDDFVLIVNYEINRRDKQFVEHVLGLQIDTVIADESHNVKNNKTAAFKMVKEIVTKPNCCSDCGSKEVVEGW